MKLNKLLNDEAKKAIADLRDSAPEQEVYQAPLGRMFVDVRTGEKLICEAGESRSRKFPKRCLRFVGDVLVSQLGWPGDPARIKMVRPVLGG
jgi:hypothetical protein